MVSSSNDTSPSSSSSKSSHKSFESDGDFIEELTCNKRIIKNSASQRVFQPILLCVGGRKILKSSSRTVKFTEFNDLDNNEVCLNRDYNLCVVCKVSRNRSSDLLVLLLSKYIYYYEKFNLV